MFAFGVLTRAPGYRLATICEEGTPDIRCLVISRKLLAENDFDDMGSMK